MDTGCIIACNLSLLRRDAERAQSSRIQVMSPQLRAAPHPTPAIPHIHRDVVVDRPLALPPREYVLPPVAHLAPSPSPTTVRSPVPSPLPAPPAPTAPSHDFHTPSPSPARPYSLPSPSPVSPFPPEAPPHGASALVGRAPQGQHSSGLFGYHESTVHRAPLPEPTRFPSPPHEALPPRREPIAMGHQQPASVGTRLRTTPPTELWVVSPNKPLAAGRYQLLQQEYHGLPVWGCLDKRIYSDAGGCWLIGAASAMEMSSARMMSAKHGGAMPHEAKGWQVYLHKRGGWRPDPEAVVTSALEHHIPTELHVAGCSVEQVVGQYQLLLGEIWGGQPVWEAPGGRRIFTTLRGNWMIGPKDSLGKDQGWAMSATEHGGLFPHTITSWVVLDGRGGWSPDPSVVVARAASPPPSNTAVPPRRHADTVQGAFHQVAGMADWITVDELPDVLRLIGVSAAPRDLEAALSSVEDRTRITYPCFKKLVFLLSPPTPKLHPLKGHLFSHRM
eukprot:Sspe_Gene.11310::Locus_3816_Transcript_1_1_Confidence_1.000_Length_1743::g.11310::m.11310